MKATYKMTNEQGTFERRLVRDGNSFSSQEFWSNFDYKNKLSPAEFCVCVMEGLQNGVLIECNEEYENMIKRFKASEDLLNATAIKVKIDSIEKNIFSRDMKDTWNAKDHKEYQQDLNALNEYRQKLLEILSKYW